MRNTLSALLLSTAPALMMMAFFMKRLEAPKFIFTYITIFTSVFISSIYSIAVCGFELSSLKFSVLFLFYVMAFYAIYTVLSVDNFMRYIHFHVLSGVCYLAGVYVMIQFSPFWVPGRLSVNSVIHPNQLCMYMEMFFPIAFFCSVGSERLRERVCWGMLAVFFLGNMLSTYSKAGLITVVICFAYYLIRKISVKKIVTLGLFFCLLSVVFYKGYSERVSTQRLDSIFSAGTRIELNKTALKVLTDNYYFFGIGLSEFTKIKYDYGFQRYLDPVVLLSSHNIYLDCWMGLGLPALIAFLYMLLRILLDLSRLKLAKLSRIRDGLMFCIISFLVHGMFDNNLTDCSLMVSLFFVLGFSKFLIDNSSQLEKRSALAQCS